MFIREIEKEKRKEGENKIKQSSAKKHIGRTVCVWLYKMGEKFTAEKWPKRGGYILISFSALLIALYIYQEKGVRTPTTMLEGIEKSERRAVVMYNSFTPMDILVLL